jgi:sodium-dependent dicarboxylate transporter 2/3/5
LISLVAPKPNNEETAINDAKEASVSKLLRREYNKLGSISFHEFGVLMVFILTVMLWLFRDPRFMRGWDEAIGEVENGDATAAMLGTCLMFLIPRDLSFITGSK